MTSAVLYGLTSPSRVALLIGLSLFFGLAYEEIYSGQAGRPGGIRTFPLLAFLGALLYLLDTQRILAFACGLLILGAYLVVYYWRHLDETDTEGRPNVTLAPLLCSLLAYALGPTALLLPSWLSVGVIVLAVMLLAEREKLHRFAWDLPRNEVIVASKFLILAGLILPLLPDSPVTSLFPITPRQLWMAVVAVSGISYAGYLLQRYVLPDRESTLWVAAIGGIYSSTATTVSLARKAEKGGTMIISAGIISATAVMYLRLLGILALFNVALARVLLPYLLLLCLLGVASAAVCNSWRPVKSAPTRMLDSLNPLELYPAFIFAILYLLIAVISNWVIQHLGRGGVYSLSTLVGFVDIDPFVLNLAQGATHKLSIQSEAAAILLAASSNNALKGAYAWAFGGRAVGGIVSAFLGGLGVIGAIMAFTL